MIKDISGLIEKIKKDIKNFTNVAIVGLSGGADSTLVACLCVEVLGKENVYGVSMPYGEIDERIYNKRSMNLANHLGINHINAPIFGISNMLNIVTHDSIKNINGYSELGNLTKANIRSRSRMCTLYAITSELSSLLNKKVRVMGTGNLSENYIGYFTKYGDGGVDIEVIGDLFKSEVYQLLDYFKEIGMITDNFIDRIPSAGLWDGQTDQGELGYSYDEMEPIIKQQMKLEDTLKKEKPDLWDFVEKRHEQSAHKLSNVVSFLLRQFCD